MESGKGNLAKRRTGAFFQFPISIFHATPADRPIQFLIATVCLFAFVAAVAAAPQSDGKSSATKKQAAASSTPMLKGDAKRGKDAYAEYCQICHYESNTEKKIGPGLKGIYKRGKFADGKPVNDAIMRRWIEDGGKDMPAFVDTLTPAQIADLLAYLRTL